MNRIRLNVYTGRGKGHVMLGVGALIVRLMLAPVSAALLYRTAIIAAGHVPRFASMPSTISRNVRAVAAGSGASVNAEMTATPSAPAAITAAALLASMPAIPAIGKFGARRRRVLAMRESPSVPIGGFFCSFESVT